MASDIQMGAGDASTKRNRDFGSWTVRIQHFTAQHWVPYPIEAVFAFFANPVNLPALMPPGQKTRIENARLVPPAMPAATKQLRSGSAAVAGIGSEIVISFLPLPLLPLRLHWVARISEFEWNHYFRDEQIEGPFECFRHRHGMAQEVRNGIEGTRVTDSIEFALPLGWLGSSGAQLVRMLLARAFHQRQRRLPGLLCAALNQFDGSR